MFKRFSVLGVLVIALSLILAACGGANDDAANNANDNNANDNANNSADGIELGGTDIEIPYVAWAGSTTRSPILGKVLEEVGYNVDVKQVEAGPMWAATADDEDTLNATGWLPATHGDYQEQYEDDVEIYEESNLIDKAPLALTVPEYMEDVNSIEDLKGNEELGEAVDWEIIGIDPGAGIMQNTEEALEEYELDEWSVTASSEAAMLAELQGKIENEEEIVVPLWKPHWIFAAEDLKMLDEPQEIYGGDGDQIQMIFNREFEEAHPAAYEIATRFAEDWNDEIENEYMEPIFVDDEDEDKVAEQFMEENQDLVEKWTEGIAAE